MAQIANIQSSTKGFDIDVIPDRRRSLFRAHKAFQEIVHHTVVLEGNPITFPEVQTLLDGITVGGRRIEDAAQVLNQAASWKLLFNHVKDRTFGLSASVACDLHDRVARDEALEWGAFVPDTSPSPEHAGTGHRRPNNWAPCTVRVCRRLKRSPACIHAP